MLREIVRPYSVCPSCIDGRPLFQIMTILGSGGCYGSATVGLGPLSVSSTFYRWTEAYCPDGIKQASSRARGVPRRPNRGRFGSLSTGRTARISAVKSDWHHPSFAGDRVFQGVARLRIEGRCFCARKADANGRDMQAIVKPLGTPWQPTLVGLACAYCSRESPRKNARQNALTGPPAIAHAGW